MATNTITQGCHRIIGGRKGRMGTWGTEVPSAGSRGGSPVEGLGDKVHQKLSIFCETTYNFCIQIQQTTVVAVTG